MFKAFLFYNTFILLQKKMPGFPGSFIMNFLFSVNL